MKKAIWIPSLIILFFIGDRVGAWILQQLVAKSQFRYSQLYTGKAEADILLLGNSRGLIFYQPYIEELTGQRTCNLSYNSLPIDVGKVLVQDYLARYKAPKQLLIDVTMCDRNNPQLISGFGPFSSYSPSLNQLIKSVSKTSWVAGQISHLYRFNGEVFQRTLNYLGKSDKDWLIDRIISSNMQENATKEQVVELKTDSYLLAELQELIEAAEAKGVRVELLVNPYYPPYAKRMDSLAHFIQQIEEVTGKKVNNYALALQLTEGFGDYQHLNKQGSKKYLAQLVKDGILK